MISPWEISANALNATSIVLAGRNSAYTWITGILACVLFVYVYSDARLYADVTLQVFFIASSVLGWWNWLRGNTGAPKQITRSNRSSLTLLLATAALTAFAYGWLLHRFTNAYSPFLDSLILAFSVLGQFLLIGRRLETWWCWLLVNSIAVPLYAARGLYVTSILYAAFWVNAIISYIHWRRLELQKG